LFAPLDFFMGLIMHSLSRRNEYEADRYAVTVTGDSVAMISALKKLAADNLTNLTPHPMYVFLNYSHPPMPERVRPSRAMRRIKPLPENGNHWISIKKRGPEASFLILSVTPAEIRDDSPKQFLKRVARL